MTKYLNVVFVVLLFTPVACVSNSSNQNSIANTKYSPTEKHAALCVPNKGTGSRVITPNRAVIERKEGNLIDNSSYNCMLNEPGGKTRIIINNRDKLNRKITKAREKSDLVGH